MAVDIVVQREESVIAWLGYPELQTQLFILAFATGLIWLLESLFEYLYRVRWRNLAQSVQHMLRMDAYDHVQHLGMSYFEDQSTGRLMAILNDDVNQLERFLDEGANDILQVITTTVVIGGIFLAIAPGIGWMTILPMPFIAWGSIWFQQRLAPLYARVREQVSVLNSHLSNNLSGIATIKSFTAESLEYDSINRESHEYQDRNREAIRLSSAFVPVIRMIIVTGFIAILYFGGKLTLSGELEVWQYSVMIFMTQRLLWPLTRLGSTLDLYQRAVASTDRVFELLQTPPESSAGRRDLQVDSIGGDIRFDQVRFSYPSNRDGQPVLRDLTLDFPRGETCAIVGATGSGKSTVVKLLLRFYDIDELSQIVLRTADILNTPVTPEGSVEIARRSRGTPRIANRLLRRVRDYAEVKQIPTIDANTAAIALELFDVDPCGLDWTDRRLLQVAIEQFNGGPVGIEALAAATGEDVQTIEEVYEPYLMQIGYLHRTPRGRVVTAAAWHHLGYTPAATAWRVVRDLERASRQRDATALRVFLEGAGVSRP